MLEYAVKMRKRGDTYYAIRSFLDHNSDEEAFKNAVINAVNKLEKEQKIQVEQPIKRKKFPLNLIFGTVFLAGGAVLAVFLWNKGFISTIPFIVMGFGAYGIFADQRK